MGGGRLVSTRRGSRSTWYVGLRSLINFTCLLQEKRTYAYTEQLKLVQVAIIGTYSEISHILKYYAITNVYYRTINPIILAPLSNHVLNFIK